MRTYENECFFCDQLLDEPSPSEASESPGLLIWIFVCLWIPQTRSVSALCEVVYGKTHICTLTWQKKSANTVVGIYHLVFDPMQEVVGSTGNEQLGQICAAGVAASGKGSCRHRMLRRVY